MVCRDSDVKEEAFLEYINQLVMTGEVAGLFPKDEMDALLNDLRPVLKRESPGQTLLLSSLPDGGMDNDFWALVILGHHSFENVNVANEVPHDAKALNLQNTDFILWITEQITSSKLCYRDLHESDEISQSVSQ